MQYLSRHGWRAVDPPRRPVLFVNPRSGGGRAAHASLVERARERGIDVVVLQTHQDLAALVGEAVAGGADALGVAGGDGSLAAVATAARAHGLPFVCVPAGTRNHFALDLGVDRHDLVGALDAFTDGVERSIDVAEVNGLVFLNNVSLGIYGDAVQQPAYRDAKLRTLAKTAAEMLGPSACDPGTTAGRRPLVADTRIPPSCWFRTTPTRSAARSEPAPGRGSTAAGWESSSSTRHTRARILPRGPGPPPDSR